MNQTIEGNVPCLEDVLYARSNNVTHLLPDRLPYHFEEPAHRALLACYIIVEIAVISSNSFIWMLLAFKKSLRTTANLLLLNLSLCNIVYAVSMIPHAIYIDIESITNKSVQILACTFRDRVSVSTISNGSYMFTLCTMSYCRFIAVRYPMKFGLMISKEKVKYLIAFFWLFFIGMITPFILITEYLPEVDLCVNNYDKFNFNYIVYYASLVFLGFILPLSWLTISYVSTRITLGKRKKQWSTQMQEATDKANQRAMATLKYLLLTFLACWLPLIVHVVMFTMRATSNCQLEFRDTRRTRIFTLIANLNGLIDPIIYMMRTNALKTETLRRFGKQARDQLSRMTRRKKHDENSRPELGRSMSVMSTTA